MTTDEWNGIEGVPLNTLIEVKWDTGVKASCVTRNGEWFEFTEGLDKLTVFEMTHPPSYWRFLDD